MPGPGQRGGIKYPRGKRKIKRRLFPPRHPRDGDPRPPQGPGPQPPGIASGGRTGRSSGGVTSWQELVKKKYSS
jgi:hypothetical protein